MQKNLTSVPQQTRKNWIETIEPLKCVIKAVPNYCVCKLSNGNAARRLASNTLGLGLGGVVLEHIPVYGLIPAIVITLSLLEGHCLISSFFKCIIISAK